MKIQIVENESLIKHCDLDKCKVFLLNRTSAESLDARVINIPELTESHLANSIKFPQLMTEIYSKYDDFEYEVITTNSDSFAVTSYVCDKNKIKIV